MDQQEIENPTNLKINEFGEIEGKSSNTFKNWLRRQRNLIMWLPLELRHVLFPVKPGTVTKNLDNLRTRLDSATPVKIDENGKLVNVSNNE